MSAEEAEEYFSAACIAATFGIGFAVRHRFLVVYSYGKPLIFGYL